jgi:hypothetical protein
MAKANRQKMQLHHTCGSVSYACSEHNLVMYIFLPTPYVSDLYLNFLLHSFLPFFLLTRTVLSHETRTSPMKR